MVGSNKLGQIPYMITSIPFDKLHNLTSVEQDALKNLIQEKHIVIKNADKVGQICNLDKEDYLQEFY